MRLPKLSNYFCISIQMIPFRLIKCAALFGNILKSFFNQFSNELIKEHDHG